MMGAPEVSTESCSREAGGGGNFNIRNITLLCLKELASRIYKFGTVKKQLFKMYRGCICILAPSNLKVLSKFELIVNVCVV